MIKISRLDNGIRIVTEHITGVRSVAVGIWAGAGAAYEEDRYSGVSHFTEHMMFKGTPDRTAMQIASDIDKIGGQINAFTGKEATCYYVKTTADEFERASDVLVDMINNSMFAKVEMDRERMVVREELKMTLDTPDDLAVETATDMIFANKGLGNSILGTPGSLARITSSVMHTYVDGNYTADNIVISVAGAVNEKKVLEYFSDKFDGLKKKRSKKVLPRVRYEPQYKSIKKDIEQSHICLAAPGIKLADDDYYAFSILTNTLGGSMSSRLFQTVRERQGLAYSVYASLGLFAAGGYFMIYAGVGRNNIRPAAAAIKSEILKLAKEGITQDELESSRAQLKASYVFSLESTSGRMFRNGKNTLLLGRPYDGDEIIKGFSRVTADDIDKVRKKISKYDRYSACIVSPSRLDVRSIVEG